MKEITTGQLREEQRPKNAGVHADQKRRGHSKTNRRKAKQELRNHDHS